MQTITLRPVTRIGDFTSVRCEETGVVYSFERDGVEYIIRNSGVEVVRLMNSRDMVLQYIEQLALLDFRTVQADCGQYSA